MPKENLIHRVYLTEKHYKKFIEYCNQWREDMLVPYKLYFEFADKTDSASAKFSTNYRAKTATIVLTNVQFVSSEETLDELLYWAAFHEVYEISFTDIALLGQDRTYHPDVFETLIHERVHAMELCLKKFINKKEKQNGRRKSDKTLSG